MLGVFSFIKCCLFSALKKVYIFIVGLYASSLRFKESSDEDSQCACPTKDPKWRDGLCLLCNRLNQHLLVLISEPKLISKQAKQKGRFGDAFLSLHNNFSTPRKHGIRARRSTTASRASGVPSPQNKSSLRSGKFEGEKLPSKLMLQYKIWKVRGRRGIMSRYDGS